jgi:hypothetical protein
MNMKGNDPMRSERYCFRKERVCAIQVCAQGLTYWVTQGLQRLGCGLGVGVRLL